MQELYGLGARRIGVVGLPVLGCVPSQRTIDGGISRACSDFENQAAVLFNNKLSSQMDALKKQFQEARLVYLDLYNPLLHLIQNPAKYGNHQSDTSITIIHHLQSSQLNLQLYLFEYLSYIHQLLMPMIQHKI